MIYISTSAKCVQLPNAEGFAVNPRRFTAARRANAGNIIRQTSAYHVSSAEARYAGLIPEAQAAEISTIHAAGSSVYLTVRDHVYVASMDLEKCVPSESQGRWEVAINFGIISEVAF